LPLALDEARPRLRRQPPVCGADTRDVLRACGYSDARIDSLAAAGVVKVA
jgi:crotonobetainyl-CoA:carnitine CoA-transferase CaiB-like acyl-CoA transferase